MLTVVSKIIERKNIKYRQNLYLSTFFYILYSKFTIDDNLYRDTIATANGKRNQK